MIVDLDTNTPWSSLVAAAAAQIHRCNDEATAREEEARGGSEGGGGWGDASSLRVYFHGGCAGGVGATSQTLELLARCYDAIAFTAPTLNLVPLLQSVGWDNAAVVRAMVLPGATHLFTATPQLPPPSPSPAAAGRGDDGESALPLPPSSSPSPSQLSVIVGAIRRERAARNLPPLTTSETTFPAAAAIAQGGGDNTALTRLTSAREGGGDGVVNEESCSDDDAGCWSLSPIRFTKVSVGGTFDRMHAGHRLLLAAASAVTGASSSRAAAEPTPNVPDAPTLTIYVGVTGDALLSSKKHRNLIQTYETRAAAAQWFLAATRPPSSPPSPPLIGCDALSWQLPSNEKPLLSLSSRPPPSPLPVAPTAAAATVAVAADAPPPRNHHVVGGSDEASGGSGGGGDRGNSGISLDEGCQLSASPLISSGGNDCVSGIHIRVGPLDLSPPTAATMEEMEALVGKVSSVVHKHITNP